MLIGTILILTLPVVPALKTVLCGVWVLSGIDELKSHRRGMSRIYRIRMCSDGSVDGFDRNGDEYPLCLLPGSVVLHRVAWLRMRFSDGLRYGELYAGNAATSEQWCRLQLIWRQRATAFGRLPGS